MVEDRFPSPNQAKLILGSWKEIQISLDEIGYEAFKKLFSSHSDIKACVKSTLKADNNIRRTITTPSLCPLKFVTTLSQTYFPKMKKLSSSDLEMSRSVAPAIITLLLDQMLLVSYQEH